MIQSLLLMKGPQSRQICLEWKKIPKRIVVHLEMPISSHSSQNLTEKDAVAGCPFTPLYMLHGFVFVFVFAFPLVYKFTVSHFPLLAIEFPSFCIGESD